MSADPLFSTIVCYWRSEKQKDALWKSSSWKMCRKNTEETRWKLLRMVSSVWSRASLPTGKMPTRRALREPVPSVFIGKLVTQMPCARPYNFRAPEGKQLFSEISPCFHEPLQARYWDAGSLRSQMPAKGQSYEQGFLMTASQACRVDFLTNSRSLRKIPELKLT